MQTLISVFEDRLAARGAMERLVQEGFPREDIHLQESRGGTAAEGAPSAGTDEGTLTGSHAGDRALGERTMATAEREVAVDAGFVERLGHFFGGLFGERGDVHAGRYSKVLEAGRSVLLVDTQSDQEAEAAASILHEMGASDVDDQQDDDWQDVRRPQAGVHLYRRDKQPRLRDLVDHRHVRNESIMADRSGQAASDRAEKVVDDRAIASARLDADKDRPA